jgi:hypothetical protein
LCTISRNNSRFAPRIESIARAICPERANSRLWEQALIIGECATVLGCVQAERIELIERLLLGGIGPAAALSEFGGSRPRDDR